jgi:hypothetical protein
MLGRTMLHTELAEQHGRVRPHHVHPFLTSLVWWCGAIRLARFHSCCRVNVDRAGFTCTALSF